MIMGPVLRIRAAVAWLGFCILFAGSSAHANLIANSGFEATQYGAGYYAYPNATLDSWTYSGQAGLLNASGSNAWYSGSGPTGFGGDQYAFVQTTGSISQTFTSAAGTYALSFLDTGRTAGCCNGDQTFDVYIDASLVGAYSTSPNGAFSQQIIQSLALSAGSHTLTFEGTDPGGGDVTSFIDNVNLTQVPEPNSLALLAVAITGLVAFRRRRTLS
jgi:hypothetical protein